jgi:uncharacterized membrane protein YccC
MPGDEEAEILCQARRRCQRLLEQLWRDARELDAPNRLVPEAERAEGRADYARAAAAAEALLRRLGELDDDAPHSPHPQ